MLSLLSFLLATLLMLAGLVFLWPLTVLCLGRDDLLTALTAFGLSVGLLSLWVFALAWLGALSVWPVLGLVALGWGLGYALNRPWFRLGWARAALAKGWLTLTRLDVGGLALLVMVLALGVVLVHDLYYPFLGEDTLLRYALHARLVYESGELPPEVRGAPLLVPLSFTYAWLVSGSVNEHLAKLVPFAFGAGLVGAAALLGHRLRGRLNGLLAGAILAVTPLFVEWAATGYTDIPAGFYTALAALFTVRWCEEGARRDALLAGTLTGLALWTKQSAFILPVSLAGVAVLRALSLRRQAMREALFGLVAMLGPGVVIAGPWYVRNYALGGARELVVLPGLYHILDAGPHLAGLLPPLQHPASFGLALVPVYALGLPLALWRAARGSWAALHGQDAWPLVDLVGLVVLMPYWLAWWTRFSFTPRFLLVVLPIYAMWAAWPLSWLVERMGWAGRRAWLAAPLAGALLLLGTQNQLSAVRYTLAEPFASDADKLTRVKGDLYPTVVWLAENLEPGERVLSMDGRLRYYLTDYNIKTGYPREFKNLAGYDYVVDFSGTAGIYQALGWTDSDYWQHRRDPLYFEEVFDGGQGSEIFRVLPAVEEAQ